MIDAENEINERTNEQIAKRPKYSLPRILDGQFYHLEGNVDDISSDGRISVKCNTCNKTRKGNIKSTGNFLSHYRSAHSELVTKLEQHLQRNGKSDEIKSTTSQNLIQSKIQSCAPPISKEDVS